MDQRKCVAQMWLGENATEIKEEEDDNADEALSLSDLPLIHLWRKEEEEEEEEEEEGKDKNSPPPAGEEFDFCCVSKQESEMCTADELFFQGQILPLRRPLSSEKPALPISRPDHSTNTSSKYRPGPKMQPLNHFHSHPSPSPRLHFPTISNRRNSMKESSIWKVLRQGLVSTPPEIAFHRLKARSSNSGSRSSSSSNSSSMSSGGGACSVLRKMRPRLLGRCKCAADDVAPRVVVIKRNASESDVVTLHDEINGEAHKVKKQHLSHHRTFEWLKQLSLDIAHQP